MQKNVQASWRHWTNYFFSSFSASAALFSLTPTWRWFVHSRRSLSYAWNDFISSVTFTSSTNGFSRAIGLGPGWQMQVPQVQNNQPARNVRKWEIRQHKQVSICSINALQPFKQTLNLRARLGKTTNLALNVFNFYTLVWRPSKEWFFLRWSTAIPIVVAY